MMIASSTSTQVSSSMARIIIGVFLHQERNAHVKLAINSSDSYLPHTTRRLAQRMLSSICGLDQMLVFTLRNRLGPRFIVAGAELTGVHVLLGQEQPGSYHIGGAGIFPHEAVIRSLGETVERYSQLISAIAQLHPLPMVSYEDLVSHEQQVLAPEKLAFFSREHYATPNFRFQPFDPQVPITWTRTTSLIDGSSLWVPAQLVLVGYMVKRHEGEPWMLPAVTTGSAAHTSHSHALRNALLELIQVDAAMGHWYSGAAAPQIRLDKRTQALERLIERQWIAPWPKVRFHWLPSPDLAGKIVACVVTGAPRSIPAIAVGLGADMRLVDAMYKALLEAVGVLQLARVNFVNQVSKSGSTNGYQPEEIDPAAIFDLDSNVAYYALPENSSALDQHFATTQPAIPASDLPPDPDTNLEGEVDLLIDSFRRSKKELVYLDLTTKDIQQLGFTALRVWSPDTLGLALPSVPPTHHPRFAAYGGATYRNPHPYP
ncbi:MAG: YcaO-like family protein [Chloroflexi bacterium]|nr:YcaO-like family protein [Chloroflexota bacterium]